MLKLTIFSVFEQYAAKIEKGSAERTMKSFAATTSKLAFEVANIC